MRSIMPSANCTTISVPVVGHQVVSRFLKVLFRFACHTPASCVRRSARRSRSMELRNLRRRASHRSPFPNGEGAGHFDADGVIADEAFHVFSEGVVEALIAPVGI